MPLIQYNQIKIDFAVKLLVHKCYFYLKFSLESQMQLLLSCEL